MRRRTKRDLSILLGAAAILGVLVVFNSQVNRSNLAEEMDAWRRSLEAERRKTGDQLLNWNIMKDTKGRLSKGGTFAEELFDYNEQPVNLMGFMVPLEKFRQVTEFLLLPIPIECYFCSIPPPREVMLIRLAEGNTAEFYEEPIVIHGTLKVHEGPTKFFYSVVEATLGPGEMDGDLTKRRLREEHMMPNHEPDPSMLLEPEVSIPELDSD